MRLNQIGYISILIGLALVGARAWAEPGDPCENVEIGYSEDLDRSTLRSYSLESEANPQIKLCLTTVQTANLVDPSSRWLKVILKQLDTSRTVNDGKSEQRQLEFKKDRSNASHPDLYSQSDFYEDDFSIQAEQDYGRRDERGNWNEYFDTIKFDKEEQVLEMETWETKHRYLRVFPWVWTKTSSLKFKKARDLKE